MCAQIQTEIGAQDMKCREWSTDKTFANRAKRCGFCAEQTYRQTQRKNRNEYQDVVCHAAII